LEIINLSQTQTTWHHFLNSNNSVTLIAMFSTQAKRLHLLKLIILINEHVYSHRGNIKTVKNKITIKEKKEKEREKK